MKNISTDRRKTLPVVKVEKDLDEENLPKRVLPILAAPHISPIQETDEEILEQITAPPMDTSTMTPPSAVPSWLKLAPDISPSGPSSSSGSMRVRHSIGLDVPGAVRTITTPSM
jgi:6-phosphofructo-2-kinase